MLEKLVELKLRNSWLYYLALAALFIPAILLAAYSIISPAVRSWLVSSADKLLKKSKEADAKLEKDILLLDKEDSKLIAKNEGLDEALKKIQEGSDADWHKK